MSALQPVSFKKGRVYAPRITPKREPGRTSERYWTEAEEAILRDHYPASGVRGCAMRLPGRAARRIYVRANKLGLRFEGMAARVSHAGKLDDDVIRAGWAELKGRGAVQAFADRLGVPRAALSQAALRLGLTIPHKKEPVWSDAELALLPRAPLHDLKRAVALFAEHGFKRSPTSIKVKATRLKISRRSTRDTISAGAAGKLLGIDSKTVTAWILAGDLAADRRDDSRLPQQGGSAFAIHPNALRAFVIDHLERIDIRRVDKFAFVALIASSDLAGEGSASAPDEGSAEAGATA